MKKLSERISDAYMSGNQEAIEAILQEANEKTAQVQKNTRITPAKVNSVLNDENSSAYSVYEFLNASLGEDWWEWEFETIERMLWIKYGVALEDINRDKIWAIKHLCNSNRPFLDWHEFNNTALSFGGVIADFEFLKRPTPGMVINTVETMKKIRPEEPFSFEVKKYICLLLKEEGIYIPPPSIIDDIKEEFTETVTNDMIKQWPSILKRMSKLINDDSDIQETVVDIQAKRLIKAESAAQAYGK